MNDITQKVDIIQYNLIYNIYGMDKVFEKDYRHFNAGNTDFNNHKEYLFVTKISHA